MRGVPEHPLVARRRREVLAHQGELRDGRGRTGPVGGVQGGVDHRAVLLTGVHVDPALVEGVLRAGPDQVLADLRVDPVTGEHRGDALRPRPAVHGGEQVADVGPGGRGDRRGAGLLGGEAQRAEQVVVQLALGGDRAAGVLGEHQGVVVGGGLRRAHRERLRVAAQVVRVLDDVVPERVVGQRSVGQPGDERVPEDLPVDGLDVRPEQVTRAVRHPSTVVTGPGGTRDHPGNTCSTRRQPCGDVQIETQRTSACESRIVRHHEDRRAPQRGERAEVESPKAEVRA
ncbi:hypothetical protein Ae168Ps1_2592c [Pseudonocardia sp. Ae168_Ps1]|nr:hypothetical protein Ae150APs1_2582c [Pseudonocardia sp. Ae150A_Ps1]OLL80186.1 hypothetical protein Ae168Ps1_2592c [Pseudonocardia sp. Ae168_Ps1]OLL85686.1 hypothetical protein Ae263Ps1_2741 [Pseudonocardia sp. Ae263_Ps1]OLL94284.1 hypothetical protein Ae356Ps1_4181c [Pseudonocardia sp. Ae356_Ps1]